VTKAVLDTNIYVDWLNRRLHERLMLGQGLVRYLSAVVLMELRAGASSRAGVRALDQLRRGYSASGRLVPPSSALFERAGNVIAKLREQGREVRRASLVGDVLIALTAREVGATLYTANVGDFMVIRAIEHFALEVVSPEQR
jgi:predicted nucleic acid-binding protein